MAFCRVASLRPFSGGHFRWFVGLADLTRRTDPLQPGCFAAMNWRSAARLQSSRHAPGEGTRPSDPWVIINERVFSSLVANKKAGCPVSADTMASSVPRGGSRLRNPFAGPCPVVSASPRRISDRQNLGKSSRVRGECKKYGPDLDGSPSPACGVIAAPCVHLEP